ncbi:uncharacterized protein LOC132734973 [Ruditapes philippinarum]|uniref:uncharacterized protein LOC132734973 n=1 Tax=Ruditapes philippinarum TaxID=129788 RepID=UPI00295B06DC|nr:uncharacterized protein LOC132734973 [Ruditapes philippinarum]
MSESYKGLSEHMLEAWSIKYTSGIHLGKACSNYLDHLYDMAINYDAVYFVTAMLPCYKLWPWLGKQLTAKQNDFGVYTQWVEENLDPTYTGYIDLETLINEEEKHGRINRKMALTVFKRSMENERDFFSSVP